MKDFATAQLSSVIKASWGRRARSVLAHPISMLSIIGLAFALGIVFGSPTTALADERTSPTGLTATAGDQEVTLRWDDPEDADIIGWSYWIKKTNGPAAAAWYSIEGSTATTTSHVVTQLTNDVTYRFRVRGEYSDGSGPPVRPAVEATPSDPDKRTAPTGLTATPGDEQATLRWDDPEDAEIIGWRYWIKETKGPAAAWHEIEGSSATTTSYVVTDLTNYVAYRFRVRAQYSDGVGPPVRPAVAATPTDPDGPEGKPAAPGDVSAKAGICEITLSWTDPGDDSIERWQYRMWQEGKRNGLWTDVPGSDVNTTSYRVNQLADGKAFYFRVRAVNDQGPGMPNPSAASGVPVYNEGPPIKYSKIRSPLRRIVIDFECGRLTLLEAAEKAPISYEDRIAVGVYHDDDNGDAIADYLDLHGYAPTYRHRSSMEAWVPADLLGPLSEHVDVIVVEARHPPIPFSE